MQTQQNESRVSPRILSLEQKGKASKEYWQASCCCHYSASNLGQIEFLLLKKKVGFFFFFFSSTHDQ